MEEVLPIEVEIPSLRVIMETKLSEAEWVQNRFDQLNLIGEKRMTALCHGQLYLKRMKKDFDKKAHIFNAEYCCEVEPELGSTTCLRIL